MGLLKSFLIVPNETKTRQKEKIIAKKLASIFSYGNVCLKSGNYLTEEEIKNLKKEILSTQ